MPSTFNRCVHEFRKFIAAGKKKEKGTTKTVTAVHSLWTCINQTGRSSTRASVYATTSGDHFPCLFTPSSPVTGPFSVYPKPDHTWALALLNIYTDAKWPTIQWCQFTFEIISIPFHFYFISFFKFQTKKHFHFPLLLCFVFSWAFLISGIKWLAIPISRRHFFFFFFFFFFWLNFLFSLSSVADVMATGRVHRLPYNNIGQQSKRIDIKRETIAFDR